MGAKKKKIKRDKILEDAKKKARDRTINDAKKMAINIGQKYPGTDAYDFLNLVKQILIITEVTS